MSDSESFSFWQGKGLWVFTALWLVTMSTALFFFGQGQLQTFDHDGRLVKQTSEMNFDQEFSQLLTKEVGSLVNTVVHFKQSACPCQSVGSIHINSVKQLATEFAQTNVELNLSEVPALGAIIPATPAVAVFDENGELNYLGPYSSGFYCSVGNGIVEPFINKTVELGATIVTQAAGCYCPS